MSNREATRDAWFQLLREASSAAGRSSGHQRDDFGSSHILQDAGMPLTDKPSQDSASARQIRAALVSVLSAYQYRVSSMGRLLTGA